MVFWISLKACGMERPELNNNLKAHFNFAFEFLEIPERLNPIVFKP